MNMTEKSGKLEIVAVSFLLLVTFLVYSPILHYGFVNFDDPAYVTANPVVNLGLTPDGVVWAFKGFHSYNWHPLTWISHMLDVKFFGLDPGGHHFVSIMFHLANTLLLFLVFRAMTGQPWHSLGVAALFALHPFHAESVAWIAERKGVLSTFFWMLAMIAYVRYARGPALSRYLLVVLFFLCGLLSKPMVVTLPLVLLLLDYWPLGRFASGFGKMDSDTAGIPLRTATQLLAEKVPLLVLSLASAVVTFIAQKAGGAMRAAEDIAPTAAAANAVVSYAKYLAKTIWPSDLSVFYPFPDTISAPALSVSGALLLVFTAAAIAASRRRPYLLTGWFWFLLTLLPVIGFIRFGGHAMADRYTYIPLTGLFVMIVWAVPGILPKGRPATTFIAVSAVTVISLLSAVTWKQVSYWRNSVSLFEHALAVSENSRTAHMNLASALAEQGDFERALPHAIEVARMRPDAFAYTSVAWLYSQLGLYDKAIEAGKEAVRLDPGHAKARYVLAVSYMRRGEREEALREYDEVRKSDPRLSQDLMQDLMR